MTIPVQTRAHSPRRDSTYLSGITVQTNRATSVSPMPQIMKTTANWGLICRCCLLNMKSPNMLRKTRKPNLALLLRYQLCLFAR
jgi:hypothetical protein